MGYELESAALGLAAGVAADAAAAELECRWRRAETRLAQALAAAARVAAQTPPDHAAAIAAQRQVVAARRCCWQLAAAVSADAD